jgi:hypothetical protein
MLREIQNPRQNENENRRRIFTDEFFDLYIWVDKKDAIVGFQLCYDKQHHERALTWLRGRGFSHERVDDGEDIEKKHFKMKPILMSDGIFDIKSISALFKKESERLEKRIADFVLEKIADYK